MDPDPFADLQHGLRGDIGEGGDGRRLDVRHLLLGAGGAVALALSVLVLSALRDPRGSAPSVATPTIEVAEESVAPTTPPPPAVAKVWPAEPVEVEGTEVRSGGHRWRVGEPGDLVAVGDWDCDGTATPAVVRPATGRLYLFDAWATEDATTTAAPGPVVPAGVTHIDAVGCGRADVRTAAGETVQVTTATTQP